MNIRQHYMDFRTLPQLNFYMMVKRRKNGSEFLQVFTELRLSSDLYSTALEATTLLVECAAVALQQAFKRLHRARERAAVTGACHNRGTAAARATKMLRLPQRQSKCRPGKRFWREGLLCIKLRQPQTGQVKSFATSSNVADEWTLILGITLQKSAPKQCWLTIPSLGLKERALSTTGCSHCGADGCTVGLFHLTLQRIFPAQQYAPCLMVA